MIRKTIYGATVVALAIVAGAQLGFSAWPFPTSGEKPTLAPLLEQTTPAVVNVSVISRRDPSQQNPLLNDPFFRRFFDLPEPSERPPQQGVGSGVIVDAAEGIVLTNHHVIDGADDIVVVLSDRRRMEAEVVGSDPGTDVGVLRLQNAENLSELPFGDSESLQVGDFVVAIGNPFGLGQTATTGIVSALGRSGINVEGYEDFIQTDASINPGNSGGALIDLEGNLIGVNTAILSPAGGNIGIGFAIPVDMARQVMEQLIEYGEVQRGRLGVYIQDLTPGLAEALDVETTTGAIVTDVEQGSPAEAAGIMQGDIVTAVNGETVRSSTELRNEIGLVRLGEEVELTLLRDGEMMTITASVGPEPEQAPAPAEEPGAGGPAQLDGAELAEIPPQHPQYGEVEGVYVADVDPSSNAALSGLQPQDIIVAVNRMPVASREELTQQLEQAPGSVALSVLREGRRLYIVLR